LVVRSKPKPVHIHLIVYETPNSLSSKEVDKLDIIEYFPSTNGTTKTFHVGSDEWIVNQTIKSNRFYLFTGGIEP
jgi:hypothetical protein